MVTANSGHITIGNRSVLRKLCLSFTTLWRGNKFWALGVGGSGCRMAERWRSPGGCCGDRQFGT